MANRMREGADVLNVRVPPYILDAFKAYAMSKGLTLRQAIIDVMVEKVDQSKAGEKSKHKQDWTEIIDFYRNKA